MNQPTFSENINKFLIELEKLNFKWELWYGKIRTGIKNYSGTCPICAVAYQTSEGELIDWVSNYRKTPLDYGEGNEIVNAADRYADYNPNLREALLKACHLEESK